MLYLMILIISAIASYYGPWWIFALVCIVLCFWKAKNLRQAAAISAAAIVTLWIGYSALLQLGEVDLMHKMAGILTSNPLMSKFQGNSMIYAAMALITGSISALAGATGYNLRVLLGIKR